MSSSQISIEDIHQLIEKALSLRTEDPGQSTEFLERALQLSNESYYETGTALALKEIGANRYQQKKVKDAVKSISEALKIFEKNSDRKEIISCNELLGKILYESHDYYQALDYLLKNAALQKEENTGGGLGETHNKIGEIYKSIREYKKAIEQHEKALQIFNTLSVKEEISRTHFYIGNCYNWADELDVAFNHLDKSLKIAEELQSPALKVLPLGSLGILFTKYKDFDKSRNFFFRAIDNANLTGDKFAKADLLKSLGNLFIQKKEYEKAEKVLKEALLLSQEIHIKFPANYVHLFLSDLYEKTGEYEKALIHYKSYDVISKEISSDELNLRLNSLQLKYDIDDLNREKQIAEQTIRLKDEFLARLSHDILTPVNEIIGTLDLCSESKMTSDQKDYLDIIKLSSFSILNKFNNIIDYSLIRQQQLPLKEEEIQLKELFSGLVKLIRIRIRGKKIDFRFNYDDGLPESIYSDASKLNRIFLNIIDNAIRFTRSGSVETEVKLLESTDGQSNVLLRISDTGDGIPEDRLIQALEADKSSFLPGNDLSQGTGLGLIVTKHLVERLHGTISINSRVNSGTVVKIEFPFKTPKRPAAAGGKRKAKTAGAVIPQQVHILLVDDNKVNQFLGKKILEKLGFHADVAGSGEAALLKLKSNPFNLVLMDVEMPGINGYQLTQMIRTTLPFPLSQIPVVALTAYASAHEKEKAFEAGMNDYVTKPYNPPELHSVILKLISSTSADQGAHNKKEHKTIAPSITQTMHQLRALLSGDENDFKNLVEMVMSQIPVALVIMHQQISAQSWNELYHSAQKLKSTLKLFKIESLVASVSVIEENARQKRNLDSIEEVFELLQEDCESLISQLKDFMNE